MFISFHIYLESEAKEFKDIIQQNFVENYYNNTMKTMMAFEWATQHCRSAKYLGFVDDDYYINPYMLTDLLRGGNQTVVNDMILGFIYNKTGPRRDITHKW